MSVICPDYRAACLPYEAPLRSLPSVTTEGIVGGSMNKSLARGGLHKCQTTLDLVPANNSGIQILRLSLIGQDFCTCNVSQSGE